jgi:hypothetical protein
MGFIHLQIEWNPWLGDYRPQIPILSALCPQLNLFGYATVSRQCCSCAWLDTMPRRHRRENSYPRCWIERWVSSITPSPLYCRVKSLAYALKNRLQCLSGCFGVGEKCLSSDGSLATVAWSFIPCLVTLPTALSHSLFTYPAQNLHKLVEMYFLV